MSTEYFDTTGLGVKRGFCVSSLLQGASSCILSVCANVSLKVMIDEQHHSPLQHVPVLDFDRLLTGDADR